MNTAALSRAKATLAELRPLLPDQGKRINALEQKLEAAASRNSGHSASRLMRTVALKPFEGDVLHSPIQMLVTDALIGLVGWPLTEFCQKIADSRAKPYRPPDVSADELPHARAVARAINRIARLLFACGWRVLGTGSSAIVFGRPACDFVFRLIHTPCSRDAWLEYALWAQANRARSPALPHIDRLVIFTSGRFFTSLAKIERLQKVGECPVAAKHANNIRIAFDDDVDFLYTSEERRRARESLPISITWVLEEVRRSVFDSRRHRIDLRTPNVMMRASDQQLVITDPVSLKLSLRPKW